MAAVLANIQHGAPKTFPEALQLFWLYALMAGVINYGRLDDLLGPYLAADLEAGRLTEDEAYEYVKCLWRMIENRRTTVNGRIIVGGRGRKHPREADVFLRLAMRAATELRYVEPQFTLRVTKDMPEEIWDSALEALGRGATYPTLYNDDVNVPAVAYAMRVDEKTAEQYVPFGCGEYVIAGQSTGTPNTCINLLKLLEIALNEGIDPMDGKDKSDGVPLAPASELHTFEELWAQYTRLLDHYHDLSIHAQVHSYEVMRRQVSFLFTSLLMDDCIARGKAVLDGGVRYLGGTNETYGNINTSDALWAIKDLVYDQKKYTLPQLVAAANADFAGAEDIRTALWKCDKYGNDLDTADGMADRLYQFVANSVRDRGIAAGMQYYLIVISNNQPNTEWGRRSGRPPCGPVHEPRQQPPGRRQHPRPHRHAQLAGQVRRPPPRRVGAEHQVRHPLLPGEPGKDKGHVQDLLRPGRLPSDGHRHRPRRSGGRGGPSRALPRPHRAGQRLLGGVRQPGAGHPAGADEPGHV